MGLVQWTTIVAHQLDRRVANEMLSGTLDTSCALNFLSVEEEVDEDLMELISLALGRRVSLNVSFEAFEEVAGSKGQAQREKRLARLEAFGRLELPGHRMPERDRLAQELHTALFPKARPGSHKDEHNLRDCQQLATHHLIGRDVFVTRDKRLLRGAKEAAQYGITVTSPKDVVTRVEEDAGRAGLPSYPAISVRDAIPQQDEADIRRVLAPLAADYPDFGGWVTGALAKSDTRVRLGEYDGKVAAVALSQPKDERVVKLSAFYVADEAREGGLGAHLLWSELRTWARHKIDKVYVTVSSRHADLIRFFTGFGFLIEGMSPRRYQDDTAELVLGKHFLRERVIDHTLDDFARKCAGVIFRVPPAAEATKASWGLNPDAQQPDLVWDGADQALTLVARDGQRDLRSWNLLDLERIFYPARFAVAGRRALMVPLEPVWANAMLEHVGQQREIGQDLASERLLLRADNAYYCYPKCLDNARAGAPILFYVTAPVSAVVGEARILGSRIDTPEELFAEFGGLGIYRLPEIRSHVMTSGPNTGKALAMNFALYVPFPKLVHTDELERIAGRRLIPQGLHPISFEEFEAIRRSGDMEW